MSKSNLKNVLKAVFSKNDPVKLKEELDWMDENILGEIPEGDRPIYGIYGVRRNELLSWIISAPGNPYVVYFTEDNIIFSKRKNIGLKEIKKEKYPIQELTEVKVIEGLLFDSCKMTFKDGKKFKIRDVATGQGEPLKKILDQGLKVFKGDNINSDQRVCSYMAYAIGDLIPKDIQIKNERAVLDN